MGAEERVQKEGAAPRGERLRAAAVSFGVPAALVALVVIVLASVQARTAEAVADLAAWLPVGYAFAAGMVASVNPCGFLLLPSYISYYLGTDEAGYYDTLAWHRGSRALAMAGMATLGFVLVFGVAGAVVVAGGGWLMAVSPWAGVAVGVAMLGLGLWLLITHGTLGILAASRLTIANRRNALLFGVVYAVSSLSCTLPIFLVVVGGSLAGGGALASFGQFLGYALGMGSVLSAVTLGAALFRGMVARWLRAALPHVHRISALFLMGAGAYLIYYWAQLLGTG